MANLTLDFNTTNECNWVLRYYVGTPIPFDPLTWTQVVPGTPTLLPDDEIVSIYSSEEDLCCFECWETLEVTERTCEHFTNQTELGFVSVDIELHAKLKRCDVDGPCTPRYKDVPTLLAKANCICSRIGVDLISDFDETWYDAFVLYDKCQPDTASPLGTWFHEIVVVLDPNYLLTLIECLCGNQKTSSHGDYLVTPVQP